MTVGGRPDRDVRVGPTEQGADAGGQLAQREGLRDVVVGAELQPDHLVELGILGREHDDRDAGFGADDAHDLDAGELGEHQVEQDEVRALGPELGQRLAPVGRGDDAEPVGLERLDERLAQGRFVLDDQDRSCHPP